jgi:4-amino-4-deoxy-L-arabinose transferase-like glycosyltransferase
LSDSTGDEAKGCAILLGAAFLCVGLGAFTSWPVGVVVFGVFLLGAGMVAK